MILLTPTEAHLLLRAHELGESTAEISTDLGLTRTVVELGGEGPRFADGHSVAWDDVRRVADSEPRCFALEEGRLRKIQVYSPLTDRGYVLYPTSGPPTALNAGIPMHRVKGIDPLEDIRRRLRTIAPLRGRVLDTATGMGYSAIEAARTAERVVTVELDPAMVELARQNPWSRALFTRANIERLVGDSTEVIAQFPDGDFAAVVHDPPTIQLAGQMYSRAFYEQVYRVLTRRGRLFHYIGDLRSRLGQRVGRGAAERLMEVGFRRVEPRADAFGLVARK